MQEKIGTAAGEVWTFLKTNGETSAANLKKELGMPQSMVDRAIGWLAREDKVEETMKGRCANYSAK